MTTDANANSPGFFRRHRPPTWVSAAGHALRPLVMLILVAPFLPSSSHQLAAAVIILLWALNFATITWGTSRSARTQDAYFSGVFLCLVSVVIGAWVLKSLDAFQ